MVTYSSQQFYKDWRYSIEKDFTSPSGEPVKYAQDGFRTWGSERHRIPFSKPPTAASVNCDRSLIAIAVDDEIYIYDAVNFAQVVVCKGHVSRIEGLTFQPGNPKVLISSADSDYRTSPPTDPSILVWDLEEIQAHPAIDTRVISGFASQATETISKSMMQARIALSTAEEESLTVAIEPMISRIVKARGSAHQRSIYGRLGTSFQSEIFSPSGAHFIYLPGRRPRSNGNSPWDVKIYSMLAQEDVLTLTGHTDALMWTGYSSDETMIGTVAWDRTMRIWDPTNGHQKYKFNTSGQNWTGGFSPDSQLFAGTCGDGSFYVYSMSDGTKLVHHTEGSQWIRALSWAADSKILAVGSGHSHQAGRFILYNVETKEVTQERILSTAACPVGPEYRAVMDSYLECYAVRFVDGGRKVVVLTAGDGGIETYNLETGEKWRFARPGIDPGSGKEAERGNANTEKNIGDGSKQDEEDMNMLVHGGYSMTVWEDQTQGKVLFASMDGDAVRIWDLPLANSAES